MKEISDRLINNLEHQEEPLDLTTGMTPKYDTNEEEVTDVNLNEGKTDELDLKPEPVDRKNLTSNRSNPPNYCQVSKISTILR